MNSQIIDQINLYFRLARTKYERLKSKYQGYFEYNQEAEVKEFFNDEPSGLLVLTTYLLMGKRWEMAERD